LLAASKNWPENMMTKDRVDVGKIRELIGRFSRIKDDYKHRNSAKQCLCRVSFVGYEF
jgi:hypothetical protein